MRALGRFSRKAAPPGSRRRRWLFVAATLTVSAAMVLFVVGAGAVVPGSPSNFESNDGNMTVDTAGNADWNSVAGSCLGGANVSGGLCVSGNYVHLVDVASSSSDDSFKPGQKQDTICPLVIGSKNPPKDDFTDVASFNETSSSTLDTFLYGATIRFTSNGTASENVELNQGKNGTCSNEPPGVSLLARTVGDKLIGIDYTNGGASVNFHVLTWIDGTDPTNPTCSVGNDTPPCWGAAVQTLAANAAEGKASQAQIVGGDNGINGQTLTAGQFAEFGVDLTAAKIIPAGACEAFPQTVWESRSSASFVSTTEDISLEHHSISTCGSLSVNKYIDANENGKSDSGDGTALAGDLTGWSFTVSGPAGTCTGTTDTSGNLGTCTTSGGKTIDLTSLAPGSYTVTENANASKRIGSNSSPFFNTDPGPTPATPPVSKTATVGVSGSASVSFGNSCYATAGFEVDGVPTDESVGSITASYSVNAGAAKTASLTKTSDASVWTGSVGQLRKGDNVT